MNDTPGGENPRPHSLKPSKRRFSLQISPDRQEQNAITRFIARLKEWIAKVFGKSTELNKITRLEREWLKLVKQAGENYAVKEDVTEGGIRYSKKEDVLSNEKNIMAKYGITNLGDYVNVQKNVNTTLRKNGFFTNPDGISRTDVNDESGMVININQSGIRETFNLDNYTRHSKYLKLLKLLTIEKVPEVIKTGSMIVENQENYHQGKNANYAYIRGKVNVNNMSITLKLAIRKSKNVNKFWVHYIEIDNGTNGITFAGGKTDAATFNSIDAGNENNTYNSKSQEKTVQIDSKEFKQWFGNSKAVNKDGTPRVLYHWTNADFTVFDTGRSGRMIIKSEIAAIPR